MLLTLVNLSVYFINKVNIEDRIQLILNDDLNKLDIHYKSHLTHQTRIADSFYNIIINKKGFLSLYTKALIASTTERNNLRNQLEVLIHQEYGIMKNAGVLQFQFVFPNNESFLRVHKVDKYGDNLSDIRLDFKNTNEHKKISRGLVYGKFIHGFRNTYPIFNQKGAHIGALEVSYGSSDFQNELTMISKIHTHFLINKDVLQTMDNSYLKETNSYTQSSENFNYLMSLTNEHDKQTCIIDNQIKLKNLSFDIAEKMNLGKKFSFYVRDKSNEIEVISFLPIKYFMSDKKSAWLVSYSKNTFIEKVLKTGYIINVFSFLIFSVLAFFIYQQTIAELRIKKEHTLLNDVINTSEDMIFITNFKTISFLNKQFKDYLCIDHSTEIQDVSSLFIDMKGYLHKDLVKENETLPDLIFRTSKEDRIVCLIDSSLNPKAFTISAVQSSYRKDDYIVTLTDITKIKEREGKIANKAFYDGLTGVYNRNKFDELISLELKRDNRYQNNFSLAIVDIDHFKVFNDSYGHLVGDEVLIMLATYLNDSVRDTDTFARWGGEEFVILFPQTTKENAKIVCDKLRIGISQLAHDTAGNITASFGLTQYHTEDTLATLFKRCDDALYDAKEKGRNRVCLK